ncbi:hypothetical protein [Paenibacillus hamazuiensis]|uniref:hypothetical protein n=1 Tax=Paenibacillus hamazuiensis TaxID=2936508 RepID=UPI00200F5BEB|nr:hypothetical protein [Paenibacillus hamazuiensis]
MDDMFVQKRGQEIAEKVEQVYRKHTEPRYIGLVVHGSAVKGGFIEGCSDIDFQLYVEDDMLDGRGNLPLELCFRIHRDLAQIDPYPFRYIQTEVFSRQHSKHGDLAPGTYRLISGRMLFPEASGQQLYERSVQALAKLRPEPFDSGKLLDHGEGRLERAVRGLCTVVWPTLYQVLTVMRKDGATVWALPKTTALTLLPEEDELGDSIRSFYRAVREYYPSESSVEAGLNVIRQGTEFLAKARSRAGLHLADN